MKPSNLLDYQIYIFGLGPMLSLSVVLVIYDRSSQASDTDPFNLT